MQKTNDESRSKKVACQLPSLKRCLKANQARETLITLPKTLEETYARMLEAIDGPIVRMLLLLSNG